jgi:hypothetical protein
MTGRKDSTWTAEEMIALGALYGVAPAEALRRFREWFEAGMVDLSRYLYAVGSN